MDALQTPWEVLSVSNAWSVEMPWDAPQVWLLLDNPCPDLGTVLDPNSASSPPESQTPALTSPFLLISWEDLIYEAVTALIHFVNTFLFDTGSAVRVQNYLNLSFGDGKEGGSGAPTWLHPGEEQGSSKVYFPRDEFRIKPLVTSKVGPQEVVLQFLVDLGVEESCIVEKP